MASITHESGAARRPSTSWLDAVDLWASVAIAAIWVAVSITAVFGPDMHFQSNDGNATVIPSAVAVGLFALFATSSIAKYGFGRKH